MLATSLCKRYAKQRDCVWIEIPIERGDKAVHSEILIVDKRELKDINTNMPHIEKILYPIDTVATEKNLQVMGENVESVEAIMRDQRVSSFVRNFNDLIIAIHITDQRLYNKFDYVLKAQFRLAGRDDKSSERWNKLMKDVLYLADTLSKVKVS